MNYEVNQDALTFAMYNLWNKDNHSDEADFLSRKLNISKAEAKNFVIFRAGVILGEMLEYTGHNKILEFLTSDNLQTHLEKLAQKSLLALGAEKVKMTDTAEIISKNSTEITDEILQTMYEALLFEKFSRKEADEEEETDEEE